MKKQELSSLLRKLHLAKVADKIRFYWMYIKNFKHNNRFTKQFPSIAIPPNYLMYESFQMDRYKYFVGGKEDAQWIIDTVRPYLPTHYINVLDWGCGPARIIRHLPGLLGTNNQFYGTDYNSKTVQWCNENIPGIKFSLNDVHPPLDFPADFFTLIYGISVLTHLSEENQCLWSKELHRVSAPPGIVLLTTHGNAFMEKLTEPELEKFRKNELVSRTDVIEGHRMYAAFHPPQYIRTVFEQSGFEIIDHQPGRRVHATYISQDRWLLRKRIDHSGN